MRVLITGSTGFVGRTLLTRLPPVDVRRVVRATSQLRAGRDSCVVVGSIDRSTDWQEALADVECVIHLAAHVHVMRPRAADRAQFHEVNVGGTERLAAQAAVAGVKRFIYLSSVKVNGEATDTHPFRYDDKPDPQDEYGLSKWQAELKLSEISATSKMATICVRPPLVYGPGVRANFLRLMHWIHRGVPLPLGAVDNRRSMVSVWNLSDLIAKLLVVPSIQSGVLMVSDGVDLSTPDLIRRIARRMGRKARLLPVPISALKVAGQVLGKQAEVERLCRSLTVDISATRTSVGWMPQMCVDEGLERTVHWFLSQVTEHV